MDSHMDTHAHKIPSPWAPVWAKKQKNDKWHKGSDPSSCDKKPLLFFFIYIVQTSIFHASTSNIFANQEETQSEQLFIDGSEEDRDKAAPTLKVWSIFLTIRLFLFFRYLGILFLICKNKTVLDF